MMVNVRNCWQALSDWIRGFLEHFCVCRLGPGRGEVVQRSVKQLSGGERRRVALALAMGFADLASARTGLRCNLLILDEVMTREPKDARTSCSVAFTFGLSRGNEAHHGSQHDMQSVTNLACLRRSILGMKTAFCCKWIHQNPSSYWWSILSFDCFQTITFQDNMQASKADCCPWW